MLKIGRRTFRKCDTCGTFGHSLGSCPLAEYESQLKAATANRITAEKLFPGQPQLIANLKAVEEKYRATINPPSPASTLDAQIARLRQAWGIA